MPSYLLADLILQIIGILVLWGTSSNGICWETVQKLTMEERMTLCNMAIEAGGKNGTIADETTFMSSALVPINPATTSFTAIATTMFHN